MISLSLITFYFEIEKFKYFLNERPLNNLSSCQQETGKILIASIFWSSETIPLCKYRSTRVIKKFRPTNGRIRVVNRKQKCPFRAVTSVYVSLRGWFQFIRAKRSKLAGVYLRRAYYRLTKHD